MNGMVTPGVTSRPERPSDGSVSAEKAFGPRPPLSSRTTTMSAVAMTRVWLMFWVCRQGPKNATYTVLPSGWAAGRICGPFEALCGVSRATWNPVPAAPSGESSTTPVSLAWVPSRSLSPT